MAKIDSILHKAYEHLSLGHLDVAKRLFEKAAKDEVDGAAKGFKKCKELEIRKLWRKGDAGGLKVFIQEPIDPRALALARLGGKEQLMMFSEHTNHPDAILAKLFLIPSIKEALLKFRHVQGYQKIAEGWLALMKRDLRKARAAFKEVDPPVRASVGRAVVECFSGAYDQVTLYLQLINPFIDKRFPHLSALIRPYRETSFYEAFLIHRVVKETNQKTLLEWYKQKKQSKLLTSWCLLRHGDLVYQEGNSEEAVNLWKKAVYFNPLLDIDVDKRLLHAGPSVLSVAEGRATFKRLCKAFAKKGELESYIQAVALYANDSLFQISEIQLEKEGQLMRLDSTTPCTDLLQWDPPLAMYLFYLRSLLVNRPCIDSVMTPLEVKALFDRLDASYCKSEKYLRLKQAFLNSISNEIPSDLLRHTLYQLLILNPNLENELLFEYKKLAFSHIASYAHHIGDEVTELEKRLQNKYLLYLIDAQLKKAHFSDKQIQQNLPNPLWAVFKFQRTFEWAMQRSSFKKSSLVEFAPSVEDIGTHPLADKYFLSLCFSSKVYQLLIDTIPMYVQMALANAADPHLLVEKIQKESPFFVTCRIHKIETIIWKTWQSLFPYDGRVHLNQAIRYENARKKKQAIEQWELYLQTLDKHSEDYQKTKERIQNLCHPPKPIIPKELRQFFKMMGE